MSDRVLTKEEIAKRMRWLPPPSEEVVKEFAEFNEVLRAEVERLEAAVQRWIPVTERLPEEGNRIVTLSNTGFIAAGWRDGKSGLFHRHVEYVDMGDVTHWMPLPAPPPREEER